MMETVDAPPVESLVGSATVAHAMPGRIRLRVHSVRGDAARAAAIEQLLSDLEFIDFVAANPSTGSVVVEYSTSVEDSDALARLGAALDVEIEPASTAAHRAGRSTKSAELAENVRHFGREANARVAQATGGPDLRIIVPGALFCIGVGAFLGAKRRRMPPWYDLLWYAFNTFEILNTSRRDARDLTQE
jgi:hypothetical protein